MNDTPTRKKVLVLAFGSPERAASTIYRIAQYEPLFQSRNAVLSYIVKKEISLQTIRHASAADVVINQKCLANTTLGRLIASRCRRLVLDFDDAVWARPDKAYHPFKLRLIENRLKWWCRASDRVIVANSYLADHIRPHTRDVSVIPMSLDLSLWHPPAESENRGSEVVVGWAGTPVSFPYLKAIAPALKKALELVPNLRYAIYSGTRPELDFPFAYTPFARGTEHIFGQSLDIGLLPLADDESARGKSPMKSIQYLGCGVPVIGNIVGATADILDPTNSIKVATHEEWVSAICRLAGDAPLRRELGRSGRAKAETLFDREVVGRRFVDSVLGESPIDAGMS